MKTFFKRLFSSKCSRFASLSLIAPMASLILVSSSQGQVGGIRKVPTDRITTPKANEANGAQGRVGKSVLDNATRPEGVTMSIREFTATRNSGDFTNNIHLKAVVSNVGAKTSSPTPYTIYRFDPEVWKDGRIVTAKWTAIKRGTVGPIETNKTYPIMETLNMAFSASQYKLEIAVPDLPGAGMAQTSRGIPTRGPIIAGAGARPTISKESNRLPEVLFVVEYRAEKEVLVRTWTKFRYQVDGNKPGSPLMVQARFDGQGFKTRLPYYAHTKPALPLPLEETTGDRDYSLYVFLPNWRERTFPTPAAAAAFRKDLPQVAGVEIKTSTR